LPAKSRTVTCTTNAVGNNICVSSETAVVEQLKQMNIGAAAAAAKANYSDTPSSVPAKTRTQV
jgi:hypothetical protein